ncbi:MAG: twin-arginine translocation signal domain-containing protein, partial [Chloroflexi bacterium]|nr:twin-arginine translocation signal domain-containing protein [Chloroflexota bacterium]
MNRRDFLTATAATAILAGCGGTAAIEPAARNEQVARTRKPVRMHVGTQQKPTDPRMLQFFKRHGVEHICAY